MNFIFYKIKIINSHFFHLYNIFLMKQQSQNYDLIIIGAGCVGMAAAYYATIQHPDKKICFVEQYDGADSYKKFWSSSFSARQNRVQYPQLYLTSFVVQSNKEWERLDPEKKLSLKQGSFWFGNRNVSTNEGNIKLANLVLNTYNNQVTNESQRIQYEYKETFMKNYPNYMQAFKPSEQWASWSAIYQPDGGSINMKQSYNFFKNNKATPYYNTHVLAYEQDQQLNGYKHKFTLQTRPTPKQTGKSGSQFEKTVQTCHLKHDKHDQKKGNKYGKSGKKQTHETHDKCEKTESPDKPIKVQSQRSFSIRGKLILITTGVQTPYFLKKVMHFPELADDQQNQFFIQEYIASYFKIEAGKLDLYKNIPTYYNFLQDKPDTENLEYSGYGFPYHSWDQPVPRSHDTIIGNYVKLGTMACENINSELQLNSIIQQHNLNNWTPKDTDHRVLAAKQFVKTNMNHLSLEDSHHYYCPIIFYKNRETVLDYLYRKYTDIVVHSGGWVGKYFPLLAKTAVSMLFKPKDIELERRNETVIGSFLNRTRFPIKSYVNAQISRNILTNKQQFNTAIIGAGCSGLYSAYRLHKAGVKNIGVFDLSYRISGRLKSFEFSGTSTTFELGGMRYIPTNHKLLAKIVDDELIPHTEFQMSGDPLQNSVKRSFLRQMYYQISEWQDTQANGLKLMTTYKIRGLIVGMNAFQIISFSMYRILTAPWNLPIVCIAFLLKTNQQIEQQKKQQQKTLKGSSKDSNFYYRAWYNYIKKDGLNYSVNMSLDQWNFVRKFLLFREEGLVQNVEQITWDNKSEDLRPLYKFGFQNILEAQFGHEAYQFVADQNGYYSNTSNAAYIDQVMAYLLDFGDVQYHTLIDGFDQINYNMANQLLNKYTGFKEGEGIYLGHKLVNIAKADPNVTAFKYELTFHIEKNKTPAFRKENIIKSKQNVAKTDNYQVKVVYANKVIFGMPRQAITNLYNQSKLLQEDLTNYQSPVEGKKLFSQSINKVKSEQKLFQEVKKILPNNENKKQIQKIDKILNDFLYIDQLFKKQVNQASLKQLGNLLVEKGESVWRWFDGEQIQIRARLNYIIKMFNSQSKIDKEDTINDNISGLFEIITFLTIFYKDFKKSKQYLKSWFNTLDVFTQDPPLQPTNLLELSACTQQMPAMKIAMNFDRNWWDPNIYNNALYQKSHKNLNLINSAEQMRGLSNTDLPIRQTLYFALGQDNLLLASYNDMITTQFWTVLQNNFKKQWKPNSYIKSINDNKMLKPDELEKYLKQKNRLKYNPNDQIYSGKEPLVKAVLKQLSLTHQRKVEESWLKQVIFQFWGSDPFGAGYHNFYSGYNIQNVMKCIRKPWAEENIHFIGQAYSNETGWVEGAFQTAQRLLTEQFQLKQLLPGYYPGY